MIAVVLSVIIFGLVHPLSKVILESGIPLSYFCIIYVGIRFLVQIPFFIKGNQLLIPSRNTLFLLIIFGAIGAGLQFFEFKAIAEGISPGTVTFLMFTYPIWLSLYQVFKDEKSKMMLHLGRVTILLIGLFYISETSLTGIGTFKMIYPVLAGLCIALWILFSKRLRNKGISSLNLSLYNDFFSLIFLLCHFGSNLPGDFVSFTAWVSNQNVFMIAFYSIFVGLIPNLLFYFGSKKINTMTCGMLMAFEPIFSTVYSLLLWQVTLNEYFLIGSLLIFTANIPEYYLINTIKWGTNEKKSIFSRISSFIKL